MRKLTGLLAMLTALAIALPAMAQTNGSAGAVQPGQNQAQVPQPPEGGVNWQGVGVGAGTVVGNLFYVPAKVVYGVLGGITGGASYLLTGGNTQTADTIWRSSLGGDYVLTPDMVSGQKPIHFSGPTSTPPPAASSGSTLGSASGTSSFTPTKTASAANPAPLTSTSLQGNSSNGASAAGVGSTGIGASGTGSGTSAVPQPADRGTGPVGPGASSAAPLPSTRIE
jgi:hypothetical protein